ncbi:MAG: hypothetical protein HYU54_09475 [Actinobacteria bacterium]|nr:hypothetical protein [Actinomycetota bacterium]
MTGLSIHVVVDQQGTEIAYLELFEWAPKFLRLLGDPELLESMGSPTSQMLVGSQKVFFFENPPDRPWTRYFYAWFMGRTMAFADADDQQRFLSWVRAYLSSLGASSGSEPTGSGTSTCQGEAATITGTSGDDELTGTFRPDVIAGLGGDDVIKARDGSDTICGGGGNDTVDGSWGQDSIDGNSGDDELNAGPGSDTLNGGTGYDTLNGYWGTDTCIHGEDNKSCEA